MKVLLIGDIVGSPGRRAFAAIVERLKAGGEADFVVANAENAAGGKGLTGSIAEELFRAGADVLTLGDHTWDQREIGNYLQDEPRVVRPLNFAPGCPGRGWTTVESAWGPVTVVSLIGRVFMRPYDCPFRAVDGLLAGGARVGKVILVDMHAEATSEKVVMGHYLAGRATAVVGTHTHVQTSDESILDGGTAYITDLGMTGPTGSALGREIESVAGTFLSGMPGKFGVAKGAPVSEGVVVDVDRESGRATAIRRLREHV